MICTRTKRVFNLSTHTQNGGEKSKTERKNAREKNEGKHNMEWNRCKYVQRKWKSQLVHCESVGATKHTKIVIESDSFTYWLFLLSWAVSGFYLYMRATCFCAAQVEMMMMMKCRLCYFYFYFCFFLFLALFHVITPPSSTWYWGVYLVFIGIFRSPFFHSHRNANIFSNTFLSHFFESIIIVAHFILVVLLVAYNILILTSRCHSCFAACHFSLSLFLFLSFSVAQTHRSPAE